MTPGRLQAVQAQIGLGQREFWSPSFLTNLPAIRHRERIPPETVAAMVPTWHTVWHPPRPFRIAVYENVFVAQEGLVLFADGRVVTETIEQHTAAAIDAAQLAVAEAVMRGCQTVHGQVVLCRKRGASVYGHWLVELLAKAWLARYLPGDKLYLVQAVPGRMSAVMRSSLAAIGIAADAIVEASTDPVWVERLICVHGLTEHGAYMSPLVVECLQAIAGSVAGSVAGSGAPGSATSIFVQRPAGSARCLADEGRIQDLARRAGYTVVDPSTLSFIEQVALFKSARRIVGLMGSALANLAFVQPGAEIYVLTPANMPDTFYWFLSNHTGARMIDIRCRVTSGGGASWDLPVALDAGDDVIFGCPWPLPSQVTDTIFDPVYYAARNADVVAAGIDPLAHYMTCGWREGRAPSASFDGDAYLSRHTDVRDAGMNPLFHYLRWGRAEGRSVLPVAGP